MIERQEVVWNYCRDEQSNPLSSSSTSFKYKTSITGNTYNIGNGEENYAPTVVKKRLKLLFH